MSESAVAESAYYHTLNARPYLYPVDSRDKRLQKVVARLLELPAEIRRKIFEDAFNANRVAVTAKSGCYCFSDATGPYHAEHQWLVRADLPDQVRQEAQRVFVETAMWELHCQQAFTAFVSRMTALHTLNNVRHVRMNVFEIESQWKLNLEYFPKLLTATFSPWQKGWTIDVPEQADSELLSDVNVMDRVWRVLESKEGYGPVRDAFKQPRRFRIHFVFPIRYLLPGKTGFGSPLWQLSVWRANLDTGMIERNWREVHLVQEATLD